VKAYCFQYHAALPRCSAIESRFPVVSLSSQSGVTISYLRVSPLMLQYLVAISSKNVTLISPNPGINIIVGVVGTPLDELAKGM